MDYPFVDNGEGGGGTWIPDAPWALSDEDADSPTHAWSDSPGTNYANGIASQSLTLAAPLFLAGQAKSPALCFNHKYDFAPGDSANAGGLNQLRRGLVLAGGLHRDGDEHVAARARQPERLHQYAALLVRFRITTDSARNSRRLAPGRHFGGGIAGRGPGAGPGQCHVPQHPHLLGGEHEHSVLATMRFSVPPHRAQASTPPWSATITNQSVTSFHRHQPGARHAVLLPRLCRQCLRRLLARQPGREHGSHPEQSAAICRWL